ncbi:MAG: FAD-binding oxidoreductase [Mesorhizobium sp.]|uniref:NAD(P)/FAD-dependent oxidoreductase n=1 Tax=Mesorhizobium sp. TaxID=1871066 RepID=UPI00122A5E63|nr:FAD-binding oxidoreductase [Mesorhizobium sp.]TIO84068.1 MAG: FAD-binding oxidoreductase [Mesorhizobium sp.]
MPHEPAKNHDVIVVGAGISGASTALDLARRGVDVLMVDRFCPAAMASGWTLAGVRQSGRHRAELPLARSAVEIWASMDEELEAETFYRRTGNLRCARNEAEAKIILDLVKEQEAAGLDIALLKGREVQKLAPAVSEKVIVASYCPSDGQADPVATTKAIAEAAKRAGAKTLFGERVLSLDRDASGAVIGLTTDKRRLAAGKVVLCAGVYGNELINPLDLNVPMEVQMVTMMNSTPTERIIEQVIGTANATGSGRQEPDGKFRCGGGHETWNGDIVVEDGMPRVRPSVKNLLCAMENFCDLVPAFRQARIERIWAGLIDQTPDALPVLDEPAGAPNLVIAFGFSGHGFCLGPVTGRILGALVSGEDPGYDLSPFRLSRFNSWSGGEAAPLSLHG